MDPKFRIAAITDEYSPDLDTALKPMVETGMKGAELRVLGGKNIMDLSDAELDDAIRRIHAVGLEIISIASPILKCVLPNSPEIDSRFQHDIFASKHTFDDQPRLAERAFEIAGKTGAGIIRVFSFWRTVEPDKCFDAVVNSLGELAEKASKHGVVIGLENEHACNISTAAESARVLKAVDHPNLKLVWDPANAYVSGEVPFPDGYRLLPVDRIAHVHAKDCHMEGHKPIWGPLGTRSVDWKGQIKALLDDGYKGWLSLETHWQGPNNDKFQASYISGWNLRGLAAA
ncbi:MAG TPA: sugar phosphate isomerase/epimerase family protein [Bryobacteraceae bacterium]|nr:sugar phosphate isomerase/epimerase family protein [Bryobacteraceae bacterium]